MGFKECPCGASWSEVSDFVQDTEVDYLGLKIDRKDGSSAYSIFLFNHMAPGCATTLALPLPAFADFIDEPIPERLRAGEDGCAGHCLSERDHAECKNNCQNAPFRRFARKYFGGRENGVNGGDSSAS